MIKSAAIRPDAGVAAPASKLTTERENPPAMGNPPPKDAPKFAAPRPISS